jgi:hypothetical protein
MNSSPLGVSRPKYLPLCRITTKDFKLITEQLRKKNFLGINVTYLLLRLHRPKKFSFFWDQSEPKSRLSPVGDLRSILEMNSLAEKISAETEEF